jgi:drug/metabolite transporter (DMT)-like permease
MLLQSRQAPLAIVSCAKATRVSARGQNRPLAGIVTRLAAMASLGVMFLFVKLAGAEGVHVTESLFYRQLIALPLVMMLIHSSQDGWAAVRSNQHRMHLWRAFLGSGAMALNFLSVMLLPLADATTIGFMVPIFATLLAGLLLAEQVGWRRWAAVLLGFAGVLIVIQPGGHTVPLVGAVVALGGAVVTAAVTLVIRVLGRTESSITTIFWFSIYTLPVLLVCTLVYGGGHPLHVWGYIGGIGLFGALGQLAITQSLRYAPVSTVMPMDYSQLIWATLFGILVFGQWPSASIWIGAPIIVGSGLFIAWREGRQGRHFSSP